MQPIPITSSLPGATSGVEAWLVESREDLKRACGVLRRFSRLGVDTEFVRSRTYFPTLGLVQVAAEGVVYLVDPLAVDDISCFVELMVDRSVLKVFHSCQEDLETLYYMCGFVPGPVFDTQIAASFLGHGFQAGYQALARGLMGLDLPKGETRSDWLCRPLTPAQLEYAALDVALLPHLSRELEAELAERGRSSWAEEEFAALECEARFDTDPARFYLKLPSAWQYSCRDLALLRDLCAWREHEAMSRDLPRSFIMTDKTLKSLVRAKPLRRKDLAAVEGVRPGEIRRNGTRLIALIEAAQAMPEDALPQRLPRPPHSRIINHAVTELKAEADRVAESLGLPPELLARKKAVTQLVRNAASGRRDTLPDELAGWRKAVIGEALVELLNRSYPGIVRRRRPEAGCAEDAGSVEGDERD